MADIALAASARDWPDRLHRYVLDHGGGRIVDRVMGADQAVASACDAFLIDDVCSFLTPRLVSLLKDSRVDVIGVYAPEDRVDAKRRLLECGITDVVEADASPGEFLAKINETIIHRAAASPRNASAGSPVGIGVTGPAAGVGITEVAISLAWGISKTIPVVLLDLDQVWPSIAQRLGLPLHPNIRTALDHAFHEPARVHSALFEFDSSLHVLGGLADGGTGARLSRHDSLTLIDALEPSADVVVADLGPLPQVERGLVREFDSMLVVGRGDPVGLTRVVRAVSSVFDEDSSSSVLVVLNGADRSKFRQAEAFAEIARDLPGVVVASVPFDARVSRAAWDGDLRFGTGFRRSVEAMARVVVENAQ